MVRGSLVRLAVGFVTGSAVGYAVHGQLVDNNLGTNKDGRFGMLSRFSPLTKQFQVTSTWDDNWDRYLMSCSCLCSVSV